MLTHFNSREGQSDAARRVDIAQCGRPEAIFQCHAKRIRAPGQGRSACNEIEHEGENVSRQRLREDLRPSFVIERDHF
jgi:hypothetical protein